MSRQKRKVRQYLLKGGKYIKEFDSVGDAAWSVSIGAGSISFACSGKYNSAAGYQWRYADEGIEHVEDVSVYYNGYSAKCIRATSAKTGETTHL